MCVKELTERVKAIEENESEVSAVWVKK
jgi:hypothetical protein